VVLDLSACTASATSDTGEDTIVGYSFIASYMDTIGNYFNTLADGNGADYIIGIIFPSCLTRIGDEACLGFNALKRVTIPENVSSLRSPFYECSNLESITIKNSSKMTVERSTVSSAFQTFYDAQGPDYSGIYTHTPPLKGDAEWYRQGL
jgi:hypothetical protein